MGRVLGRAGVREGGAFYGERPADLVTPGLQSSERATTIQDEVTIGRRHPQLIRFGESRRGPQISELVYNREADTLSSDANHSSIFLCAVL